MTGAPPRWRADRSGSDEQGSIILVMLMIVFMTIVLITAMTGAIGGLNLSSSSASRNNTLQAATAGVQAAVTDIRSASTAGLVAPTELPCTTFSGVTNNTGTPTYSVSMQYYAENVSGGYVPITCSPGSGPQVTVAGDYLSRVVITACAPAGDCPSSGTPAGTPIWRRVVGTYTFETTNVNIAGGVIYSYQDQECLVAVPQTPITAGVSLDVTNSCANGNSMASREQFQYTSTWNLEIELSNTLYCIQDPEDNSLPESVSVALVACSGIPTNPAVDQWGINDTAGIEGVSPTSTPSGGPNGWCLNNPMGGGTAAAGTVEAATMTYTPNCGGAFSPDWSWQLSPSVGSGGASPTGPSLLGLTAQMVNYQQFGLCMDVTNEQVDSTYLIDYDCKQFPDTADYPAWNQRWCFLKVNTVAGNQQGLLYTDEGETTCTPGSDGAFCATSPQTLASASGGSTAYVTVTSCSLTATPPVNELWTAWSSNGGLDNDYTWTDNWGSCMEANPNNTQNPGGDTYWSTIQVDTCNGSYAQKWDAPATLGTSQLSNTHEGTGDNWVTGP